MSCDRCFPRNSIDNPVLPRTQTKTATRNAVHVFGFSDTDIWLNMQTVPGEFCRVNTTTKGTSTNKHTLKVDTFIVSPCITL